MDDFYNFRTKQQKANDRQKQAMQRQAEQLKMMQEVMTQNPSGVERLQKLTQGRAANTRLGRTSIPFLSSL